MTKFFRITPSLEPGSAWRPAFLGLLAIAMIALVAGCGGGSSSTSSGGSTESEASTGSSEAAGGEDAAAKESGDLEKVSLKLDWLPLQQHAGYYAAQAEGFYAEEGLDVEIEPGEGSTQVVQQVSTGHDDFGNAYGLGVVFGDAAGAKVKAVANYNADASICIAVKADSGITEPKDFEGKTVGNGTGSPFAAVLPIVWANSGTNGDNVTLQEVNPAAGIPSLAQGRIDGFIGNSWEIPLEMEEKFHVPTDCILYKDYGAELMGPSIIASDEMIEKNPELVQKFVDASIKGWLFSFEDPKKAAEDLHSLAGDVEGVPSEEVIEKAQPLLVKAIPSQNNIGLPYGQMAAKDWESTESIMKKYLELEGNPKASELFTNEFVPTDSPAVVRDGIPGS